MNSVVKLEVKCHEDTSSKNVPGRVRREDSRSLLVDYLLIKLHHVGN